MMLRNFFLLLLASFGVFFLGMQTPVYAEERPIDVVYHESSHSADVNDFGYFSPITSVGQLMQRLLTFMLGMMGSIALLAMILGGFMMMSAGIDEGRAKKGKEILYNASIGVAVAVSSLVIVTLAQTFLFSFGT